MTQQAHNELQKPHKNDIGFDYEVLHRCQFELLDFHNNSFDCGEPATHKVWWAGDGSDAMLVCPEHFHMIRKRERRNDTV